MNPDPKSNQFSDNQSLIAAVRAGEFLPNQRITSTIVQGQQLWVKRPEKLGLIRYLQKGNAAKSFAIEQAAHIRFEAAGLPVPKIIAYASDFTICTDSVQNLKHLFHILPADEFSRRLTQAALALATFHNRSHYHGRPSLKDICWDGNEIRFLDFERAHAHRDVNHGIAQDLIMFVFNVFAVAKGPCEPLSKAIAAYREETDPAIWQNAQTMCHRYRWLSPATWPIRRMRRAWEFKAIPHTLHFFATH